MTAKEFFFTAEGLTKLQAELEHLRSVRRPEVAEKIYRAKERGSTENNAEYEDAKNEQAFVEGRILTLERMLQNAVVIDSSSSCGRVKLGSKVLVRDQDGREQLYTIVGSAEVNPSEGKISNESPVGRALLEQSPGDEVEVSVPAGLLRLKIIGLE